MSDEPLYCAACGLEVEDCDHPADAEGPYCHVCGVVPRIGGECRFYEPGRTREHCITTREQEKDEAS